MISKKYFEYKSQINVKTSLVELNNNSVINLNLQSLQIHSNAAKQKENNLYVAVTPTAK